MSERFFAPCPRGLEPALEAEFERLGATDLRCTEGGVAFVGSTLDIAYFANLESRVASRILWQVGEGAYRNERDLYELVRSVEWKRHFRGDRTLRVDTSATRSPLKSLEFVTLKVKDAICDTLRETTGQRPDIDKERPDVRVHSYLTADRATIYLDTSGDALFKRGYRREQVEAPLRENLAAGLLALAGWTPESTFLDPLAGSGTIAIEAALIASDRAPGLKRTFAFQKLAWYDGPSWQRIRQAAQDRVRTLQDARIFASDSDPVAISRARVNAAIAGVGDAIAFECVDVLVRAAPAAAGTIVANPPYGMRLDDSELPRFYPRLGDALKQRFAGWNVYLLSADTRLAKSIGLKASRRTVIYNGALECRLLVYRVVAGSMRKRVDAE